MNSHKEVPFSHVPEFTGEYWLVTNPSEPSGTFTFLTWSLLQDFLAKNTHISLEVKKQNLKEAINSVEIP